MIYKFLLILTLTFSLLNAETFKEINPTPTEKMLKNLASAPTCSSPIPANEEISEHFKYGCFCGKNYPKIHNTTTQDVRKLSKTQRINIIKSYFTVKPYDDIDAICQQHDLCYLYQGKKAKACNNAIYDELYLLINKFEEANQTVENKQCQNLSSDIASVFKTIFTTADDENSIFQLGALLFNTSLTVARKTLEESVDTIIEQGARYPQKDEKCLVPKN